MSATKNCIICFQKATGAGGHVHKGDEQIIASFCKEHFRTKSTIEGCKGCYGEWKEEMGIDKSFGQMMYIDKKGMHPLNDDEL